MVDVLRKIFWGLRGIESGFKLQYIRNPFINS